MLNVIIQPSPTFKAFKGVLLMSDILNPCVYAPVITYPDDNSSNLA